jgi:diaminopimelate epimerase
VRQWRPLLRAFRARQGLTDKRQIRVETLKGIIEPRLEADGNVTVDMGEPRFLPAEIPFLADDDVIIHLLDVADETLETSCRWATRMPCRWSTSIRRRSARTGR